MIKDNKPLAPGEEIQLNIEYSGYIDEEACYIDIDESKRLAINRVGPFYNAAKRYSFIDDKYVLLTWENMWYPKSGVTYSSKSQFSNQTDFTLFSLNVKTNPGLEVISQGSKINNDDGSISFVNKQPLPKLSLLIGKYEKRSVVVDSVSFNLFTAPNHNYFEASLDELGDTLFAVIKELKQDYEREVNLEYPYDQFSLIEVPIQFYSYDRIWTTSQENNQPQMTFLPEQGVILDDSDFYLRINRQERWGNRENQVILPKEQQATIFKRFVRNILFERMIRIWVARRDLMQNPFRIFPNYYSYTNNLQSDNVSVFNKLFEGYVDAHDEVTTNAFSRFRSGVTPTEQAVQKLYDKPLSEMVTDTTYNKFIPELLRLKGDYLFAILEQKVSKNLLLEITKKILVDNRFTNNGYDQLVSILKNEHGIDLDKILNDSFFSNVLPGYYITGVDGYKIIDEGRERYQTKFTVTNLNSVDGLVRLSFEARRGTGEGRRFGRFRGGSDDEESLAEKIVAVQSNKSKEVFTVLDEAPGRMTINTILSENLPLELVYTFEEFEDARETKAIDGEVVIDKTQPFEMENEKIVDNEDKGFILTKTEQTSMLKRLLNIGEDNEKYIGLNGWNPPGNFRATINTDAFGQFIRSLHYTDAGDGSVKVSWNVELESSGYYDVYAFIPKPRVPGGRRRENKIEHHYKIFSDDGEEEITIDVQAADAGWNILGSYYLSEGEAKVELTNQSPDGIVIADAVKWVKRR
jgi:hypothetical protein